MGWWEQRCDFADILGLTLTSAVYDKDQEEVRFTTVEGDRFVLWHDQDCCESVRVEDISGDLSDLVGSPILLAEEVSSDGGDPAPEYPDSWTWTFYKLATIKGSVTIRWLGESNGYYSERVDFRREPE